MTLDVALEVEADGWRTLPGLDELVTRTLNRACACSGATIADHAEVSVLLCDDAHIRQLNKDWRGKDKATNVLSFPTPGALARRPLLGDIAIAWETTAREAADEGKGAADHLTHLLVHGFLHLLGFDHESEADADAMEAREIFILKGLGISDPYHGSEPEELRPA